MCGAGVPARDVPLAEPHHSAQSTPSATCMSALSRMASRLTLCARGSSPKTDSLSPMEEAEQKRQNGEVATDITPQQAAKDAEQVSLHYC